MLTNDEIKEIYNERLLKKKPVVEKDNAQWVYLNHFLPSDKEINILDAGCGNGNFAFKLAEYGYKHIYAIDLFEEIKTDNFEYQQGSIEKLPYSDKLFDFIYCFSVIFYLDKPEKAIKEFYRVTKPGAIVIISAHTKYSLFTLWRKIKLFLHCKSVNNLEGVKFYSARYYARLLKKNGFDIIREDGFGLSFIIYPFYRRKKDGFKKYFGMEFPVIMPGITKWRWLALFKSVFAYHSIIIAKRK
jgi:SAM-dependent methyltransferase